MLNPAEELESSQAEFWLQRKNLHAVTPQELYPILSAVEAWTWTLQDFLAGLISPQALATNAIAPQIVLLQYAIGSSVSLAASTNIGNALGEGSAKQARKLARLSVLMVPVFLLPTTIAVLALRDPLPRAFTADTTVAEMVRNLLLVTQVFAVFDSHQAALTGILTGVGKQAIPAPLIVLCYWIVGVPIGVVLAFGVFGVESIGLDGLWCGMIVAVILHALSFGIVVWRIDWDRSVDEVRQRQGISTDGGSTSLQAA